MELELESSITCPLGLSITKPTESSPIASVEPPSPLVDHHQSSDPIDDLIASLSIKETKIGDDVNNGTDNGDLEGEVKSVSEIRENGEDADNNGVDVGDWAEEIKNVSEIGEDGCNKNCADVGDWAEETKDVSEIVEEKGEIEDEIKNEETEKECNRRRSKYPVRPDAEDCSFFLRTGACKFGMNCKFNHPPNHRKFQGVKVKTKEDGVDLATQKLKDNDDSVDKEQIDCKYFDRPGGCKFGKACKFNHSRKSSPALKLNFMGLPIRLGEKECPFYMRNGSCKYGENCWFNHPDPTTIGASDALPRYGNGGSIFPPNVSQATLAPWSPPAPLNKNPPYVPVIYSPTQAVPSQSEWNPYQAPVFPPERSIQRPPPFALNNQLLDRAEKKQVDEFPERPGQPECSHFLKTGECKYKSACKFHHPKSAIAQSPSSCLLSDLRLPLRPGENVCSYYSRYGICKYGPACKYDHPIDHAHSSELTVSTVDSNFC